jgi:hypothetical protein
LNDIKEYKQMIYSITFHPKTRRGGVLQNHNRPRYSILLSVTDMRNNVRMKKESKSQNWRVPTLAPHSQLPLSMTATVLFARMSVGSGGAHAVPDTKIKNINKITK